MLDIDTASHEELLKEWEDMEELWGMYSCDCFGFYMNALHSKIESMGGWPSS